MPINGRVVSLVLVWFAMVSPAAAQMEGQGTERFFAPDPEAQQDPNKTAIDGSLTSTSFFFRETSGVGRPLVLAGEPPANASPADRVFTDLRAQLNAAHIGGKRWDFRGDVRTRAVFDLCRERETTNVAVAPVSECTPVQSGSFGKNEFEAREFYLVKSGSKTDWTLGRQFVTGLAAAKVDGLRLSHRSSEQWSYVGFAGLYPNRISRDVRNDYPTVATDPGDPMNDSEKRAFPVTAGAGAEYRVPQAYGSFGVMAVAPLAKDVATNTLEANRVFATAQGYYRRSSRLDLYHYAVLATALGAGSDSALSLNNLNVGANYRPSGTVRINAQVTTIDTDTLNIHAQGLLENRNINGPTGGQVQNNIEVLRLAQQSARLSLSSALWRHRLELSAIGLLRRRPGFSVLLANDDTFAFPESRALDVTLQLVDRQSIRNTRIGAELTRTQGLGSDFDAMADTTGQVGRSDAWIARVNATRDVFSGRGELDANVTYIDSNDESRVANCNDPLLNPLGCFGTSSATTLSAGATVFYRPKQKWYLVGVGELATQSFQTADLVTEGQQLDQGRLYLLTVLARIGYRF